MQRLTDPVFTYGFAREQGLVPLGAAGPEEDTAQDTETGPGAGGQPESPVPVRVAVRPGYRPQALIEARRVLGRAIVVEPMSERDFDRVLSEIYAVDGFGAHGLSEDMDGADDLSSLIEEMPKTADLLDTDDDAPIIRLINGMIAQAAKYRASDIHVEPFESRLSVRLRIDGVLQEVLSLSARVTPLLVSRIKVMARLDIAEKRVPQDGRVSLALGGKSLDIRVSTLPARHGERVVMRLLDKDQAHFDINALGMGTETLRRFRKALSEPNGIILVTGPTGSGKTTTLYAGLGVLNDQTRNILTVEDPVEYALEGVGQTQVNAKVGMTFAAGLRAILRQDPDVVMVGEIRDVETAQIAVQASLTGHVVLSTIHTNDAVSAITRLRDMGVEAFLLASTVKAILAQRLVRRLCPDCRVPHEASPQERALLNEGVEGGAGDNSSVLFGPGGCEACKNTGYKGRLGLYELVLVDHDLRRLIHDDGREGEMAEVAFREADTLLQAGLRHVRAGTTSLAEVLHVCRHGGDGHGGL
ncbi:MAG: type II secretion system ATPase GspE [Alphaproteobacteria bacterium]